MADDKDSTKTVTPGKRIVVDLARTGSFPRPKNLTEPGRSASAVTVTAPVRVVIEDEASRPLAGAGAAAAADAKLFTDPTVLNSVEVASPPPLQAVENDGELSFEQLQAQLRGAQENIVSASPSSNPKTKTDGKADGAAGDISFSQLQAQLRNFKDTAPTQSVMLGDDDGDDKTAVNPNAPKHRGVLASDYDGPSYSELRRKAAASGDNQNRQALPLGYMLQEYKIEQILGIGGFGISYLAHDGNLNSKVAIKEYLPNDLAIRDETSASVYPKSQNDAGEYRTGLDRFLLESRTLATFRHNNIVRVNRFFELNNTAYMVMDYEFGESLNAWLKKRLDRGEDIPDEKALLQMFLPLLTGLEVVHGTGFLHRDIKPANIYVRDGDGSLVLLDFGAARQAAAALDTGLTSIVTPGYAPFEQYHSHGRQGPWSDLYAFGGVLYWMIAGKKPIEAAARIQNDPQEPIAEIAKGRYSEKFLKAIDWALLPDDQKRPQSAADLRPVLIGDNDLSESMMGGAGNGRRSFLKWGMAAGVLVAGGVGYGVYRKRTAISGEPLKFGLVPGGSRGPEELQMKTSLQPMINLLQAATLRPVEIDIVENFKQPANAPKDAKPRHDIIMAVTAVLGSAARDQQFQVIAKFRDLFALVMVRADSQYVKYADLKGSRVGLLSRNTSIGPIGLLTLETNGVDVKEFKEFTEFKLQDEMVDALAERRVDVIAVSVASSEDALKRYGNRLRVFAKSDPFPGYGIAVSPAMDKDLGLKITQFFWSMDESPEGKAALAANMVGSSQGSTELREATTREYVRATEQIERLRKVYPAAPTK